MFDINFNSSSLKNVSEKNPSFNNVSNRPEKAQKPQLRQKAWKAREPVPKLQKSQSHDNAFTLEYKRPGEQQQ